MGVLLSAVAVLVSGGLLLAALPPVDFDALAWVCLVPILALATGRGFAWGGIMGLAAAMFAAWLSVQGLLYSGPRLSGDASWHYVGFLIFGVVMAGIGALMGEMKRFSLWSPLAIAAIAVTLESVFLVYLPVHLGLTQYRSLAMLELASVGGIWAVSYVLWLTNITFALLLNSQLVEDKGERRSLIGMAFALAVIAFIGAITKSPRAAAVVRSGEPPSPEKRVMAALQTHATEQARLHDLQLSAGEHVSLCVWPELSAITIAPKGDTRSLVLLARSYGVAPYVTTFNDDANPLPHNVAAAFSPQGESDRYFKRMLFGGETTIHEPGERAVIAKLTDLNVGLNICFDSCFPGVMRDTAKAPSGKPDVIALPSMGPESPYGLMQAFHGAYTCFRSAELGVPIVRGEISAYAMITDAEGRILALGPPGYEGPVVAEVPLITHETVYKTIGDWVLWLCWGGTMVATGKLWLDHRRKSRK